MKTLFGSRGRAATVLGGIGTLLMGTCIALVLGGGTAHAAGGESLTVSSATRDCASPTTPTIGYTASGLTIGTPYGTRLIDPSDVNVQADGQQFVATSASQTESGQFKSSFGETPIGSGAQSLTLQLGDLSIVKGISTFKVVASAPVNFASCSAPPPPPACTDVSSATFIGTINADGTATVKLTNGPLCSAVNVYEAVYQGVTTGPPSSTNPQTLTGSDGPTALQQPGDTANLRVTPPLCNGQIDLITAAPQATLTSDYYTTHNQLISSSNESTVCTTASTTPPPVTTSSPPPVTTSATSPTTTSTVPVTTTTSSSSTAVAVPSSNTPSLGVKYVTDDYGTLPSSNRYMTLAVVLGVVGLLCMIGSAVTLKASRPTRRH